MMSSSSKELDLRNWLEKITEVELGRMTREQGRITAVTKQLDLNFKVLRRSSPKLLVVMEPINNSITTQVKQ